jgi:LCP family protein required for cell wall assembly
MSMIASSQGDGRTTGRATVPGAIAPPVSGGGRVRGAASVGPRYGDGGGYGPGGRGPGGPGGGGDGGSGGADYPAPRRPRRKPRWGRIALVTALVLVLIGGLAVAVVGIRYYQLNASVSRTDPFSQITGGRPAKTVSGAQNILMLGSDSRDPDNKAQAGEWRTDTIILLHIPASHDKAYLISIPRDLYVFVPKSPTNPKLGNTRAKINAAYAWGGLPLTIQTVEGFTGVRIDHVVLIDFGGFKQVTDALGGVDLNIEQDVKSIHPPYRQFHKGMQHLNGEEALDYVRQRKQFAEGDFARMRHQQQFMRALMQKATDTGTVTNPAKLNNFLQAAAKAMTVDKDLSIADMALQFRNIRGDDLTFMVSPHAGTQDINGENVVVSDKTKATALYQAVAGDHVADWQAANSPSPKPSG